MKMAKGTLVITDKGKVKLIPPLVTGSTAVGVSAYPVSRRGQRL